MPSARNCDFEIVPATHLDRLLRNRMGSMLDAFGTSNAV